MFLPLVRLVLSLLTLVVCPSPRHDIFVTFCIVQWTLADLVEQYLLRFFFLDSAATIRTKVPVSLSRDTQFHSPSFCALQRLTLRFSVFTLCTFQCAGSLYFGIFQYWILKSPLAALDCTFSAQQWCIHYSRISTKEHERTKPPYRARSQRIAMHSCESVFTITNKERAREQPKKHQRIRENVQHNKRNRWIEGERERESPTARIKHDSRMRRNIEALFNPKHRLKSLLVNSWLNWYSIEYTGRSLTSVFRWFARHMHVSPAFLSWVKCVDFVFDDRRDFGQINDLLF